MTDATGRLRANVPGIAAEEIDGEVVVVSFDSGHYYSLRDTAADIWRLLDSGLPAETVVEAISAGNQSVSPSVMRFIAELQREGLMVADQPNGHAHTGSFDVGPYSHPKLERFEEMSDMLLYDPIHDVDDSGWPNLPAADG